MTRTRFSAIAALWRRLLSDRRGNVLMIMGFATIPLALSTGMVVDYSRAARLQTKMNAAADAAALMAVSKPMMEKTNEDIKVIAKSFFTSQVSGLPGLTYDPANVTVTITGTVGASNTRTAVVSYTAQSQNAFGGLLKMATTPIGGTSSANSSQAPNIDFYLLLDVSQSMLLPATTAGYNLMTSKAPKSCAFACHITGATNDNYAIARANNITLRTDLVNKAVSDVTAVAKSTAAENGAKYRMGISSFFDQYQRVYPTTPIAGSYVVSDLDSIKAHASDAVVPSYCKQSERICGQNDNDTNTSFTNAFNGALSTMPLSPGDGTNVQGDTPQAILFLITDGMRDEAFNGNVNNRKIGPLPTELCDSVKARGIRIAVLYTEYLPGALDKDPWSVTNVRDPLLKPVDKISPPLIACASPGLYYEVTTDSDISAALAALFQKAVATAHLTQ
ncbi:pilus assembly protein TadG-related protein [Sphingomonas cannabina]|uniref:TadE/TadG family type IV pilus assembly protein n=1 Tax=Sphingomonas cannabina TaxID=2899123 RepID=UPI001F3D8BB9|nr:pilus assembly protein TadG-related protein [Sphingomonas cannabina]UIJ43674.1 pilus assembly protein TadG-related protein [Sphingomonas cannabina]